MAKTRAVLQRLMVERYAGGRSQRDMEDSFEKALGQCVLSKSAGREWTATLTPEYEGFRPRDLSGSEAASRLRDAVYEPLRRWGRKTGVCCGWARCVAGRKVRLPLSTAHRES